MTKHVHIKHQSICESPFFVASADEMTRTAFHDIDCADCLRQALAAAEARTRAIRELLVKRESSHVDATCHGLCHVCHEMVEIVCGKLAPHHGTTGEGCPQNQAIAQISLHPVAAKLIAELQARLVFEGSR